MCKHCGCDANPTPDHDHPHPHGHSHDHHHAHTHGHRHPHGHDHEGTHVVDVRRGLLDKNDHLAAENRARFRSQGVRVVNLLSSPGSGKTALLERTLRDLTGRLRVGVIVGDLATDNDARRLGRSGAPVVQVTTGTVCHLDAAMVARAARELGLDGLDLVVIENVGNLVCPAAYDLGEDARVVLLSVTEGEDKPLKYPTAFRAAHAVVISKTDLIAAAGFDREAALRNVRGAAPRAVVCEVSARTGEGLGGWYSFLLRVTGTLGPAGAEVPLPKNTSVQQLGPNPR
jgi:hydrogenase nickel incorporation protein HypB